MHCLCLRNTYASTEFVNHVVLDIFKIPFLSFMIMEEIDVEDPLAIDLHSPGYQPFVVDIGAVGLLIASTHTFALK